MRFGFADCSDANTNSERVPRIWCYVESLSSLCGHVGSGHKSFERIFKPLNFMLNMDCFGKVGRRVRCQVANA